MLEGNGLEMYFDKVIVRIEDITEQLDLEVEKPSYTIWVRRVLLFTNYSFCPNESNKLQSFISG